ESVQAGFAQNDRELRRKNEKEPAGTVDAGSDSSSEGEDAEAYKKLYNRMEAKLRRMCTVKQTGKCDADKSLLKQWKEKGHSRTQLVKLMIEADGALQPQAQALPQDRTIPELFDERSKVKKIVKYCEEHGLTRTNKYDTTETEYWVDYRTEGVRGVNEVDGMEETGTGLTDGFVAPELDECPMPSNPQPEDLPLGLHMEQGKKAELLS
ncbi:unnamed protein product, partial [Symbiodinium sp. CCMP2456]